MSRVAIFAPKFPPTPGGAAVYTRQLADVLTDTAYTPVVFAPERDDQPRVADEGGVTVYRIFPALGDRIYAGVRYLREVHDLLGDLSPVLAHVHPHFPQYRFFRWLLQYHAIPRVYDCRDHTFTRWYVRDGRAFLAATSAIDDILAHEAGVDADRIHRAPVVMPDVTPAPVGLGEGRHVAFVGDCAEHKGVHLAADAVGVLAEGMAVTLHVAGDGPLAPSLAAREHVRYHGRLGHACALGLLAAADVVALPSASEGRPRVALEAMHVGTPIVGSMAGELPDVVGDAGIIVPREPGRIHDGLRTVLADGRYAERARRRDVGGSETELREGVLTAYRDALNTA